MNLHVNKARLLKERARFIAGIIQGDVRNHVIEDDRLQMAEREGANQTEVVEPVKAQDSAPDGLQPDEADLYRYLLTRECGRLEQEYLPRDQVERIMTAWAM